jgi:regulatory protein
MDRPDADAPERPGRDRSAPGRTRRQPRPVTAERLRRSALHHLARFATTEARLRQALDRKIARSVRLFATDAAEALRWVEDIVQMLRRQGLLDDPAWAARRARALQDRGVARALIQEKLRAAGIRTADAAAAIEALGPATDGDAEAAWTFARRRRLGPFRPAEQRAEYRMRDLGRMARGGFSYEIARAVIDKAEGLD